jgi:hypothetical protein
MHGVRHILNRDARPVGAPGVVPSVRRDLLSGRNHDPDRLRSPMAKQRVNIDYPLGLLRQINAECQRIGVTRQGWIKMACDERLHQVPQHSTGGHTA